MRRLVCWALQTSAARDFRRQLVKDSLWLKPYVATSRSMDPKNHAFTTSKPALPMRSGATHSGRMGAAMETEEEARSKLREVALMSSVLAFGTPAA